MKSIKKLKWRPQKPIDSIQTVFLKNVFKFLFYLEVPNQARLISERLSLREMTPAAAAALLYESMYIRKQLLLKRGSVSELRGKKKEK